MGAKSKEAKINSLGEVKKILLFSCTKHRTTCNTHKYRVHLGQYEFKEGA